MRPLMMFGGSSVMMQGKRAAKRQLRIFMLAIAFSGLILMLLLRMAWLTWLPSSAAVSGRSDHWQGESVRQREWGIILDPGRADFVDRSGHSITGETIQVLAAFPVQYGTWGEPDSIEELAAILQTDRKQLLSWLESLQEPRFWSASSSRQPLALTTDQIAKLDQLKLNAIRVLPFYQRYPEQFSAKHVIGYLSQHPERMERLYPEQLGKGTIKRHDLIGGSGLEKSLDALLRGVGPTALSHYTDGSGIPLQGLGVRLASPTNPYYPLQVATTLDLELQNKLERMLGAAGLKEGAVVVLDAQTADIAAMISLPLFQPQQLDAPGTDLSNHALEAVAPGSIFKLVTAAAALETKTAHWNETFHCSGEYGRYGLSCWKHGGHGSLTLGEALAQSCNVTFAALGERLSASEFLLAAEWLGIGRQVGWNEPERFNLLGSPLRLLEEEQAGQLFAGVHREAAEQAPDGGKRLLAPSWSGGVLQAEVQDGGVMAQTAIGQRDVQMTPLQAANLMITLLGGGEVRAPRLVTEIRYANGQRMMELPAQRAESPYGRISPATARLLLRGMEAVVARGTGQTIRHGVWEVAGKSGTAQTAVAGQPRNHQWFAGYGPVEAPRYAVAVLSKNRLPQSSNQATLLFRQVMDLLAAHEQERADG
ncbi:penicillin-binding protein [Paenibacillaceae bacterium]|nr:penicillin-binding protein [Paenibacillaceae bacterium]